MKIDINKIETLIKWWKGMDTQGLDITEYLFEPIMEAFGDDVDEVLSFLAGMEKEDLYEISGIFEDIYDRWTTNEVWKALEELQGKIR